MSITVNEAGRIGGLTTSNRKGREFFSEIGLKGQKVLRIKHPGMASIWGKMGGRPRKPNLDDSKWEQDKK